MKKKIKDLFETPNLIPKNVQEILDTFDENKDSYEECARLKNKLNLIGYDFEYYLDGVPYDLHKINE